MSTIWLFQERELGGKAFTFSAPRKKCGGRKMSQRNRPQPRHRDCASPNDTLTFECRRICTRGKLLCVSFKQP